MLIRVIFLLLLASNLFAGELIDNWPRGKTEKMKYEIKTFKPRETVNYNYVEISRTKGDKDIFIVQQKLDMPSQQIKINSKEEYAAKDLRLLFSVNEFLLPERAIQTFGTDSLVIEGKRKNDSLYITSNAATAEISAIALEDRFTTSTGTQLIVRNTDFSEGMVYSYSWVNLLKFSGQAFQKQTANDSVTSIVAITTPVGTFDCFRVANIVPGAKGFSYYTTDNRHIPMLIELINPENDEILMTLTLQEYE